MSLPAKLRIGVRSGRLAAALGATLKRDAGWRVQLETAPGTFGDWSRELTRDGVLARFGSWPRPFDRARFRVGRGAPGAVSVLRVVRVAIMRAPTYPGGTDASDVMGALFQRSHPRMVFAGCFVCKGVVGHPGLWSQHAWGRAVDWSAANLPGAEVGPANAACTDWAVRMGRLGQLPGHEVIGRAGNAVVYASTDTEWEVKPGGDSSHLFHTHVSTGAADATGTPPCAA